MTFDLVSRREFSQALIITFDDHVASGLEEAAELGYLCAGGVGGWQDEKSQSPFSAAFKCQCFKLLSRERACCG
jgi:hypothetical protein